MVTIKLASLLIYSRFLGLDLQPLPPLSAPENVGRARAEIPAAVREHLHDYYREPNQRLQALLPDFPLWDGAR